MVCQIETIRENDGRWTAKVPALPGLQIYGNSEVETLAIAGKLNAVLLQKSDGREKHNQRILAFYPGRVPVPVLLAA
jgi:hypothetical protein